MNTSFTSFEEEQTQAAKDLAEISRLAKTIEKPATVAAPLAAPQEAQVPINNPATLAPALENSVIPAAASFHLYRHHSLVQYLSQFSCSNYSTNRTTCNGTTAYG